jgi:trans-2,3-dihydro-3-hydroxyanthranilate isomerase
VDSVEPAVTVVDACLRDGRGGSPTAVLLDGPFSHAQRRRIPARAGTSHAVFVSPADGRLRFFTSAGELPACGHGTVAALAYLADGDDYRIRLRAGGRVFDGRASREGTAYRAMFDPGPVEVRDATTLERDLVLSALGVDADTCIASVGRPRMLACVDTRDALAGLTPDLDRLRAACDRLGLLGCYVHTAPTASGRVAARMFAPSIGVPEDIANANSTACLAARVAATGLTDLEVDTGDAVGSPATIVTAAHRDGPRWAVAVGGVARLRHERPSRPRL